MNRPLISVPIPSYNHEKYIDDCIDSLLSQTYTNAEIIFNDDASTDKTWDRILARKAELEQKFVRVIIHRNEINGGITKSLNYMIGQCRGDIYKSIASDDMLDSKCFENIVDYFTNHPEIDFVLSSGFMVSSNVKFPPITLDERLFAVPPYTDGENVFEELYHCPFTSVGMAFKMKLFDKYGKYDENITVDDWEIMLRFASNGVKFGFINDPLFYYRRNPSSITSLADNDKLEQRRLFIYSGELAILNKYRDRAGERLYHRELYIRTIANYKIAYNKQLSKLLKLTYRKLMDYKLWGIKVIYIFLYIKVYKVYRKIKYKQNIY